MNSSLNSTSTAGDTIAMPSLSAVVSLSAVSLSAVSLSVVSTDSYTQKLDTQKLAGVSAAASAAAAIEENEITWITNESMHRILGGFIFV